MKRSTVLGSHLFSLGGGQVGLSGGPGSPATQCFECGGALVHLCISPFPHLVIGRGGEQINKIQQDSGCKVQISPGTGA